jgi:hypothetical protein
MSPAGQRGTRSHRNILDKRQLLHNWRTNTKPELVVKIIRSLDELEKDHVVLKLECIDRMYRTQLAAARREPTGRAIDAAAAQRKSDRNEDRGNDGCSLSWSLPDRRSIRNIMAVHGRRTTYGDIKVEILRADLR